MIKVLTFIFGFVMIIFGITLVLRDWGAVVLLFQGAMPMVIAVGGLVIMFAASIKK